jgi:hypothetical protein
MLLIIILLIVACIALIQSRNYHAEQHRSWRDDYTKSYNINNDLMSLNKKIIAENETLKKAKVCGCNSEAVPLKTVPKPAPKNKKKK